MTAKLQSLVGNNRKSVRTGSRKTLMLSEFYEKLRIPRPLNRDDAGVPIPAEV